MWEDGPKSRGQEVAEKIANNPEVQKQCSPENIENKACKKAIDKQVKAEVWALNAMFSWDAIRHNVKNQIHINAQKSQNQ